jgi:hypothetical protein
MKLGIVGRPSSGKSTFFSAATMIDVAISPRPFTTIKPNVGQTYVRTECVCKEFKVKDAPRNSKCENGTRLIPVTAIDVAGLVPDAHLGKGLGNQFMNDLMEAEGLIHTVDLSGKTDSFGNPAESHDPEQDILFLQNEIDWWIQGILEKNWSAIERKSKTGTPLWEAVWEQVSGLGIKQDRVKDIVEAGYKDVLELARKLREANKPIILAGNKIDMKSSQANYERLKAKYDIMPVCAEAELALRKADKSGLIKYVPGSKDFDYLKELPEPQKKALEFIRENVLKKYGGTGVQQVINKLVLAKLDYITAYPVEDEGKLADGKGNVLPDVYLVKKGGTALDLAFKVHTAIGQGFIGAIDARTKRKVGKEYALKDRDVLKIVAKK